MTKKVLLVIDMVKDFIDKDGALSCGPAAQNIISYVVNEIKNFSSKNNAIIFINDNHLPDDLEFTRFPPHCIMDSSGAKLIKEIEELKPNLCNTYDVLKNRYSGFFNTNLEAILREIRPDEVHIIGVCTNICVLYTVEELCNRDYHVFIHENGVASFDQEAHNWALKQMETVLGAKII